MRTAVTDLGPSSSMRSMRYELACPPNPTVMTSPAVTSSREGGAVNWIVSRETRLSASHLSATAVARPCESTPERSIEKRPPPTPAARWPGPPRQVVHVGTNEFEFEPAGRLGRSAPCGGYRRLAAGDHHLAWVDGVGGAAPAVRENDGAVRREAVKAIGHHEGLQALPRRLHRSDRIAGDAAKQRRHPDVVDARTLRKRRSRPPQATERWRGH